MGVPPKPGNRCLPWLHSQGGWGWGHLPAGLGQRRLKAHAYLLLEGAELINFKDFIESEKESTSRGKDRQRERQTLR